MEAVNTSTVAPSWFRIDVVINNGLEHSTDLGSNTGPANHCLELCGPGTILHSDLQMSQQLNRHEMPLPPSCGAMRNKYNVLGNDLVCAAQQVLN